MASLASQLDGIFKPKSIAVVGASTRPGTVGNDLFRNLLGEYQGCVYPINPKAEHIMGVHCFPTLSDVPGDIDLAVLIVPAKAVLGLIDEAKAKNAKGMIIISAGFKEVGAEGAALEKQVAAKVREAGIPLIGPNCLGVINAAPEVRMNASFAPKIPGYGKLAFFSQSGALCTSVLDYAEYRQMGFSKFISFGNKADVKETDILEYLADDPETNTIAMYLEDISDGQKFIDIASKIFWEKKKPLICLKSGRSAEGARAVSSHTGSLAGSDQVYNAIFAQCGVQRVKTISELFDFAALYTTQPMPKGNRLAIVTNAGGPGIMATDAAVDAGLKLAEISEATKEALKPNLPAAASLNNPVDVIGDARCERYEAATRVVLEDPNVDMGIVILTPQSMTDADNIGVSIPKAVAGIDKPVIGAFMGVRTVAEGVDNLVKGGIPNYALPEDGINALGAAYRLIGLRELERREYVKFNDCDVEKAKKIIADALGSADEKYLTQAECRPLLECYNLPLLKSGIAHSADEAASIVKGIGRKVVMKVMSADVVHKFDAGGVILNVDGPDAAKATYSQIFKNVEANVPGAKIDGILIEEMAARGTEVIVGCNRDANFGPLMMFGLGGTLVEVLKDVTFRLAPMWKVSAERMVREIKAYQVLDGFRGAPKADVASIVDTILRLSEMVTNHPEIAEMDINPLIVHAQGAGSSVADSRVMLRKVKCCCGCGH